MTQHSKVLIIEDEPLARQRLKKLLQPYANQINLIGEAKNGAEGVDMIEKLKPQFIFLDIKMPVLNGFEMLLKLSYQPHIIFTTAFDEYAIKAFENNSIDYLLKPIRPERLEITMDKILKLSNPVKTEQFNSDALHSLIEHLQVPKAIRSLTVHLGDKIIIVKLDEIVFFKAEDKYVLIHTNKGEQHLITQSLSQLEQKLPDYFLRINRSSIINENEISEIRKGFNRKWVFEMKDVDHTRITAGTSYMSAIKNHLKF